MKMYPTEYHQFLLYVLILHTKPPFLGNTVVIGVVISTWFFGTSKDSKKIFHNHSSDALDIYMNMSYQPGFDWKISLVRENG